MDFPDPWIDAWQWAWPAWLHHLRHAGWHPLAAAAAEGGAALLCLAAARVAMRNGIAVASWRAAATLLVLLTLNTLFALDLLAIELARSLARGGGWYEARRSLQAAVLAGLAALALAVVPAAMRAHRFQSDAAERRGAAPTLPKALLMGGLALLAAVTVLRAVSLHATDQWLATRLAGVSLGRLMEALGLLLVVSPALASLRRAAR